MVNARKLHSFVTEHERKLDAKIEAVAADAESHTSSRHATESGHVRPLGQHVYHAVLWAKFVPRSMGRTWPMRYEVTPRN
jgi:hypothetical protein